MLAKKENTSYKRTEVFFLIKFFDAHIHLSDFKEISSKALIGQLKKENIEKCVCVSAHQADWEKIARLAHDYPLEIVPAFGIHPWYVKELEKGWVEELEEYLKEFPQSVIGECGFDKLKSQDEELERKVFDIQLRLAFELKRPMILHMVKATAFLENYWGLLPQKCVFHSFAGPDEMLKRIMKFRHYISVNNRIFKKAEAAGLLKKAPIDRLLIETDAPYQSSIADMKELLAGIAAIRGENIEKLSERLYQNALEVFIND